MRQRRNICRQDLVEEIHSINEGDVIKVVPEHECEFYTGAKELNYNALKCSKCGNETEFVEFAMRETKQPFTVGKPKGEVDWSCFDFLDEAPEVEEIVCGKCYREELVSVWKKPPN